MRSVPILVLLLSLLTPSVPAGQSRPDPNFEALVFAPRKAICYRTPARLTIDGKLDEAAWRAAPWSAPFVDIEGEIPLPLRTRVRMLWDDERF
jgi:hypothetical protein